MPEQTGGGLAIPPVCSDPATASYRQQLSARAAARRKRLANIVSPEFQAWFDQYI